MNIVLIGFICPLFLSLDIAGLQDPNITSERNTRFIIELIFYYVWPCLRCRICFPNGLFKKQVCESIAIEKELEDVI